MDTNLFPNYDMSDNPTGCCPRFKPDGWENAELHFENKKFMRAETKSALHIPINMGSVFEKCQTAVADADAQDANGRVVLSRDLSPWKAEHLIAVSKDVPDQQMVDLTGDFVTKVFEGSYREMKDWQEEMLEIAEAKGHTPETVYFFFTTCPKCAKTYGENYVVGVVKLEAKA